MPEPPDLSPIPLPQKLSHLATQPLTKIIDVLPPPPMIHDPHGNEIHPSEYQPAPPFMVPPKMTEGTLPGISIGVTLADEKLSHAAMVKRLRIDKDDDSHEVQAAGSSHLLYQCMFMTLISQPREPARER